MSKIKYTLIYANEVYSHLKVIDRKYLSIIKKTIEEQLIQNPDIETINKKPLTKPSIDDRWELRFGPQNQFRVFYKIDYLTFEVLILAIGIKIKEKLYIGNKEVKL